MTSFARYNTHMDYSKLQIHDDKYKKFLLGKRIAIVGPSQSAFLDKNGIILNIIDMSPHTRTKNSAASKAKYALEMNLGWYSPKNIKAGKKITGLEKAPNAE